MTVQNTIVKNVYVGNGSTTVFPFTFECNKAEHIQAFVKDAVGNISSTTNFKVNLDQKNVTYPNTGEPLPDGYKLIILRQLPLQQLLNLLNQGPFYAEDIEETFDEVVMMLQQMTERIGRSLAVSIDIDAENSFNTIIPLEAGKTFRVKDDGTGFEVTEDPGKVIDGAKALLKQTTQQAEFAKEQADASSQSAVSAQNAANAAEAVAPEYAKTKEVLDNIVGYTNTATEQASIATAKADAASTSATNAAQSYTNADAIATQLTEYLETKETLTAPAVDKTLLIGGAAADAKTVGELKSDLKNEIFKGRLIFTNGNADGYFNGEEVLKVSSFKHIHLTDLIGMLKVHFNILKANDGILYLKNADGNFTKYGAKIGEYSILIGEASELYINFFGQEYCEEVTITTQQCIDINELDEIKSKITCGQNLFNLTKSIDGRMYNYADGTYVVNENYCTCKIFIDGETNFSVNGVCPIACYDKNGSFLGGFVNERIQHNTFTTPIGTNFMYVSPQIAFKNQFMVYIGSNTMPYEPYYDRFVNEYYDKLPYQNGYIHFTVPVCQYTFRDTSISASVVQDNYVPATLVDVPAVIKLPLTYSRKGKKCPLIIICHGAGYGVTDTTWGASSDEYENSTSDFQAMIDMFVDAGYAVCDINGYNSDFPNFTWGCPRAVQAYRKLYEYVVEHYNVDEHCHVYGFSMGGLVALNFCFNNRDIVKCLGLGAPLTALYEQLWNSAYGASKNWRKSSAVAYDFLNYENVEWQYTSSTPNESEQTCWDENKKYTIGFEPRERIKVLDNTPVMISNLPPLKIWLGTNDVAVDIQNTDYFVRAVQNSGAFAFLRLVNGGTHGISFGTNKIIVLEIIYWFNRFIND